MSKEKIEVKKKNIAILMGILLLMSLSLNFVSAVPPVTTTVQAGSLEIIDPTWDYIPQNGELDFYWHLFNTTTLLTNNTANCSFHLYAKWDNGEHLYTENNVKGYSNERDFEVIIAGTNFSKTGEYCFLIECWTPPTSKLGGGQVGGIERCFEVTPIGLELTSEKSAMYILIWIVSLLFFVGLLTAGIKLPSKNNSNEMTGYILAVNNLKYLKMFCLALAYLTAMFLMYYTWMISYAYLDMEFMTNIFHIIFYAMAAATLPLFIVSAVIIIANIIRDAKIQDWLSRGLDVKE